MTAFRRFGVFISVLLLCACLVALAFLAGLPSVFTTPTPLKSALQSSGIYDEVTSSLLANQTTISGLSLKDVGIRTAFTQALPATFYQHSSEQIIDSTYNWMQGRAATPEFSIDLTAAKSNFADNISAYVQQQLDGLPRCKSAIPPPQSIADALSLTCLPPKIIPADVTAAARQQALESGLLLKEDTLTAGTLKDKQGRTFAEQMAFLPNLYRSYVPVLLILLIGIAALIFATTFWSGTRKIGLRRVAWILLSIGIVGVVLAAVGIELFHIGARVFGLPLSVSPELQDKLLDVIERLAASDRPWWLGVYAGYTLTGIVLFIILRLRRPKQTLTFSSKN